MVDFCAFKKMFLKVTLPFLFLGCFLTTNLASPTASPRLRHDAIEDKTPFKDVGESFKELTKEIEKSFKHLTRDSQWIYNNMVSILKSGIEEGVETMATWIIDFVLRVEFLVMADGSHYIFPISGKHETEQQYKAVSIAVSKLLMNLKTMDRTDKVIRNVTKNLVSTGFGHLQSSDQQKNAEKMMRTFLHEYFEALDKQMETDEVLRDEYKERLAEAQETVKSDSKMRGPIINYSNPKTIAGHDQVEEFLQDKETFQRAVVNKMFLKQTVKHFTMIFSSTEHKRYLLAKAVAQKAAASPTSESKVNEVYQRALIEAGKIVLKDDDIATETALFESLERELESDPTLHGEIQGYIKEIEKNTVYDTDMLYTDFTLL